jgi:beta-N-acetylhexosaminidase
MKNRRAFIVGIKSKIISKKEILFLNKYKPWGIILFSRNINNLIQVKKLVNEIKTLFRDPNYPILIDQEGGRVSRLSKLIDSSIFTAEYFGKLYKKKINKFKNYYKVYIDQISYLLNEVGININTVPVLDIRTAKGNNIIGDRSYSLPPDKTSKIGNFCIKQFSKNHIGTVIKHIPGHGLAKVDSHKFTPLVKKKISFLLKNDFSAFKHKNTFFAMTAHVIYKDIDPINPATHSKKMIEIIRKKIGFKNIIISDDISMKGLKYSIKLNTLKALSAGCNLILHCNGNMSQMKVVAKNSPLLNAFILKKTSQFYNFLS